jgi:hypothetical protein
MRLNNESGGSRRRNTGAPAIERVESLLRQAADFEPAIQPANDFVRVALRGQDRRRVSRLRPLVLGFSSLASGVAAAALLLFFLSHNEGMRGTVAENGDAPAVHLPNSFGPSGPNPSHDSRDTVPGSKASKSGTAIVVHGNSEAGREPRGDSDGATAGSRDARLQIANYEPRPHSVSRSRERETPIPKVRWQNEVVQRYDRGVIEPAYVVEERDRNGDVVYKPVMMPVTQETGARPILVDGMPDTSIQLTNPSGESSQK